MIKHATGVFYLYGKKKRNSFFEKEFDKDESANERIQVVAEKTPDNHGYRQEMFGKVNGEKGIKPHFCQTAAAGDRDKRYQEKNNKLQEKKAENPVADVYPKAY